MWMSRRKMKEKIMQLNYRVAEHEESFGIMSVHSSEVKAKEAIAEYEAVAAGWVRGRADYSIEELELDSSYYGHTEVK